MRGKKGSSWLKPFYHFYTYKLILKKAFLVFTKNRKINKSFKWEELYFFLIYKAIFVIFFGRVVSIKILVHLCHCQFYYKTRWCGFKNWWNFFFQSLGKAEKLKINKNEGNKVKIQQKKKKNWNKLENSQNRKKKKK